MPGNNVGGEVQALPLPALDEHPTLNRVVSSIISLPG